MKAFHESVDGTKLRGESKMAVRFLRSVGGDVDESALRSFQRRRDMLVLLLSERLGVIEFLYSVSVKKRRW